MCVCVCVYAHTHTHTAQMGYSVVGPGVGIRHLEGPKNPDGLNLGVHIFVHVYKVHGDNVSAFLYTSNDDYLRRL